MAGVFTHFLNLRAATSWYNASWGYRDRIVFDHTKVSGTDQMNFPVLINSTNADWKSVANGGHVALDSGNDILFTSDNGSTKLSHEIEKYDPTTGELVAWVRVPVLDHSADTAIYVYYGNGAASDQSNRTGVWDANYKAIYHLDESSSPYLDSTSNANNSTSGIYPTQTAGKIYKGQLFDGSTNTIVTTANSSLDMSSSMTLEYWVSKTTNLGGYETPITKRVQPSNAANYESGMDNSTKNVYFWGGGLYAISGINVGTDGTWHHIAIVTTSGGSDFYLDGVFNSHTAIVLGPTNAAALAIGSVNNNGTAFQYFKGALEDLRISNTARGADWIATEYANQDSPSTFYTIHPDGRWYDFAWSHRSTITIDHTKVVGSDQSSFPVLVHSTVPAWKSVGSGGFVEQSNGNDILFTFDDGVSLPDYEIEKYDPATGELIAWVRVPMLSSTTNTTLYMYYGNASATTRQNKTGVWTNYVGVWHLPDGTTLSANDSTSNANNGTIVGATATAGQIDGAGSFNGSNTQIDVGGTGLATANITVSAWVNSNATQAMRIFAAKYTNVSGWALGMDDSTPNVVKWFTSTGNGVEDTLISTGTSLCGSSNTLCNDTWYHVVGTYDGTTKRLYINGVQNNSVAWAGPIGYSGTTSHSGSLGGSQFFNGAIDEVEVSNVVRSSDWIATEYNNQSSPDTFYAVDTVSDTGPSTPPPPSDITHPTTSITSAMSSSRKGTPIINGSSVTSTSIVFAFTATDPDDSNFTYECSLDAASFSTCTSPVTYAGLIKGQHSFIVQATDPAENTDLTPPTFTWTVKAGSDGKPSGGGGSGGGGGGSHGHGH